MIVLHSYKTTAAILRGLKKQNGDTSVTWAGLRITDINSQRLYIWRTVWVAADFKA